MPTTSASDLTGLCGALVAIVTIIGALRFYARVVQRASLEADDWMIIPSYVTFIGMVACALLGVRQRIFGYSEAEVAAAHLTFASEAALVTSLDTLSAATLGFSKISALLFFRRIFCVSGRNTGLRVIIHTAIVVVGLWTVAFIILPVLQCGPNLSVWSAPSSVRAKYCGRGSQIILGFVISDLILEVSVIALPVPRILRLQASFKRRLGVLCVFLTAFVSLGAVIARLVIVAKLLNHKIAKLSEANTTQVFMWVLEAGFALIAVNLPSLWWLRHKISSSGMLSNLRSVFSLQSLRSKSSQGGRTAADQPGNRNDVIRPYSATISNISHDKFPITSLSRATTAEHSAAHDEAHIKPELDHSDSV